MVMLWFNTVEVDGAWLALPLYTAWMGCVATLIPVFVRVARPELTLLVPSNVAPSKNCTVPVAALGLTLAVKVRLWIVLEGFRLEVRLSVVAVRTLCESAADVLALVVASPEYTAVMAWLPAASVEVV